MNELSIRLEVFKDTKEKLQDYVDNKWQNFDLKNYHFLSANLTKFFFQKPISEHKSIYFDLLAFRSLQTIDTSFYNSFNKNPVLFEQNREKLNTQQSNIYVSYHLGSYRSALAFLIQYQIDVALIVDPIAYKMQKDMILQKHSEICSFCKSTSKLIIYPANLPNLSIELLSKTKQRYSVLAFIDGNSGFNGVFNQKKSLEISFMGQQIRVRKGLSMLSYITKCPIVPLISYYNDRLSPEWEIYSPIRPKAGITAEEYSIKSTTKLFAILEGMLDRYFNQWEGWMYIHKVLNMEQFDNNVHESFQNDYEAVEVAAHAGLFAAEGLFYVMNKLNYRVFQITEKLFNDLKSCSYRMQVSHFDKENLPMLFKNGILIQSTSVVTI